MSWLSAQLHSVVPLSERVSRVVIFGPFDLCWGPGQHVALKEVEPEAPASYYSIASAPDPARPGRFELAVGSDSSRFFAGPMKRRLLMSRPGGGLDVSRVRHQSRLVLIGMGTGIAPLRSTIQWVLAERLAIELTLVVGARSFHDRLFADEWEALSGLDYRPVLSRPDDHWSGRVGRVQEHLDELPRESALFYVCGSRPMTDSVERELLHRGVPKENLVCEGF